MSAAQQSPPSARTPARQRTASDQIVPALLCAAESVLDREGERGVTIRAVAREAAVAPMGVYNHFSNREGLLIALAVRAFTELGVSMTTADDVTSEQRFRQICCGYREFANAYPERYKLIFSTGSPVKLPLSQEASDRGNEAFTQLVDAIDALMLSEELPTDIGSVEAAQIVWNALHGAVTIEHAQLTRTTTPTETFNRMITLLLNALRANNTK
jgi:AcrR family transcriptional regulator